MRLSGSRAYVARGLEAPADGAAAPSGSITSDPSRSALGRAATDGESPVGERIGSSVGGLSTTGHEEPRGKQGGPPSKAKYPTDR